MNAEIKPEICRSILVGYDGNAAFLKLIQLKFEFSNWNWLIPLPKLIKQFPQFNSQFHYQFRIISFNSNWRHSV